MKSILSYAAAFVLAALTTAPFVRADFATTIPADARWVIRLDIDAIRKCAAGRELVTIIERNTKPPKHTNIQIDIRKVVATVNSITAYGTVFSKNPKEIDGTMVFEGTAEFRIFIEGLVTFLSIVKPEIVTEVKGLPIRAYSIQGEITVAFPPEPLLLISRSQPQLVKTYDLYRGKGSVAVGDSSSLKGLIPKNNSPLFFAASEVPNAVGLYDENQPQARILKMSSAASLTIGTDNAVTTATVQLVALSDDLSEKLLKVVQGVVAMLAFSQSNDSQLASLLQSAKAERNDRTIAVTFACPTEGLVQMMHNIEN